MSEAFTPANVNEACIALHELFVSLQSAGFTENQAIALVAATLARKQDEQ